MPSGPCASKKAACGLMAATLPLAASRHAIVKSSMARSVAGLAVSLTSPNSAGISEVCGSMPMHSGVPVLWTALASRVPKFSIDMRFSPVR